MFTNNFISMMMNRARQAKKIKMEQQELEDALKGEEIPILDSYTTITVELIKLITNKPEYYNNFEDELVKHHNDEITVYSQDEIGFKKEFDYKKFNIIDAFNWAKDHDKLTEDEIEKLSKLQESSSFKEFVNYYKNQSEPYDIEGKFITLPIIEFIDFMTMSPSKLYKEIESGIHDKLTINEFVFALDDFIGRNNILKRYYIPDHVKDNLSLLYEEVDIAFINRCIFYENNYLNKIKTNDKFREEILSNISEDFDTLEKSFYIYYEMCKKLTYDEEQYARREDKDYTIKHKDINRIRDIDSNNNKVVCYEFNAIYANFLKEIGVIYELEGKGPYSASHTALTFRVDDYLLHADSTVGLISSDLSHAKNGLKLTGFSLETNNKYKNAEYNKKISKVYDYISRTEKSEYKGTIKDIPSYDRMIPRDLDMGSKLNLFISLSNNSTLPTVDKIPYQIKLRDMLFSKDNQIESKFVINFISNKKEDFDEHYSTMCLVSFNENGLDYNPQDNTYIAVDSNGHVDNLSYEDMKYNFRSGKYKSAITDRRVIPGMTIQEMNGKFEENQNKTHK